MNEKAFMQKYGLTTAWSAPIVAKPGFDFEGFYKKYESFLIKAEFHNHTFPLEKDFSGKIDLVCLEIPPKKTFEAHRFTTDAQATGYLFVGLKGIILGYEQLKRMFIPERWMAVPNRLIGADDYQHSYEKDMPVPYYDGSVKYSSTLVDSFPARKHSYYVLLGKQ